MGRTRHLLAWAILLLDAAFIVFIAGGYLLLYSKSWFLWFAPLFPLYGVIIYLLYRFAKKVGGQHIDFY
jgi:H+/Cl- antiporter ClcA